MCDKYLNDFLNGNWAINKGHDKLINKSPKRCLIGAVATSLVILHNLKYFLWKQTKKTNVYNCS